VGCLASARLATLEIIGRLQWINPSAEALPAKKTPANAANAINLVRMTTFSPLKSDRRPVLDLMLVVNISHATCDAVHRQLLMLSSQCRIRGLLKWNVREGPSLDLT
jgi:hypothetical protein